MSLAGHRLSRLLLHDSRVERAEPDGHSSAAAALIEQAERPTKGRRRQRVAISADTVDLMERRLELHVFPYIGEQEVQLVQPPELLAVLRRIEARGNYDLAHRVRSICSRVFRYARATGRRCEDVAADLLGSLMPVASEHLAAIVEPAKIGALLRSIEAYRGAPLTRLALKLVPYVFPRPIELRTMEWAHVQLSRGVARVARALATHEDARAAHRAAVASGRGNLREIQPAHRASALGVPAIRKPDRPMCEGCITAALRALGYDGTEMTWHGFRALASTQLHELGWHELWIETQLAHADRNKVRAAYNHAKYLPQRRTMMQAWADYLDSLRAGAVSSSVSAKRDNERHSPRLMPFSTSMRSARSFQAQAMEALRAIISLCPQR